MKYGWIENHRDKYTVSLLCRVLSVSRNTASGACGRPARERWQISYLMLGLLSFTGTVDEATGACASHSNCVIRESA